MHTLCVRQYPALRTLRASLARRGVWSSESLTARPLATNTQASSTTLLAHELAVYEQSKPNFDHRNEREQYSTGNGQNSAKLAMERPTHMNV